MGHATETSQIAREKRLRRAAARQGLRLSKSAQRDPHGKDYGKYRLENPQLRSGSPMAFSLDLDEVEAVLFPERNRGDGRRPLRRDEDYENAITPHAPHDGNWMSRGNR